MEHSTESALLKVKCDLLHAMDSQEVTCLMLLDLSAAFDTVDMTYTSIDCTLDMDLMEPYKIGFQATSDQEHNRF